MRSRRERPVCPQRDPATIGGSDVGAILGLAPPGWATARDVWERIVSGRPWSDDGSPVLEFGRRVEPAILDWYLDLQGIARRALRRSVALSGADRRHPELAGTVDGLIRRRGETWIVEAKSTAQRWITLPPHYLAQALHYLWLAPEANAVDFAILHLLSRRLDRITVERRDHEALVEQQHVAVVEWWERHLAPALAAPPGEREQFAPPAVDEPPPVVTGTDAALADGSDYELIRAYREAAAASAAADEALAAAREALLARLRERGVQALLAQDGSRLAWVTDVRQERLDTAALRREAPELCARVTKSSTTTRLTVARER